MARMQPSLTTVATDNEVIQEVDTACRFYLKIGGAGQWLELYRAIDGENGNGCIPEYVYKNANRVQVRRHGRFGTFH